MHTHTHTNVHIYIFTLCMCKVEKKKKKKKIIMLSLNRYKTFQVFFYSPPNRKRKKEIPSPFFSSQMIAVGPASPTNLTYSVTTRSNQPTVLGIFFFCPFQISLKSHAPPPTTPLCWSCNLVQRKKIKIKNSRCTLGAGGENGQKQGTDFFKCPPCSNLFLLADRQT